MVVDTSKPNQLNYPVSITILSPSTYRLTIDDKYNISKVLYFGQKFNHESLNFMLLPRHPESLKNLTGYPLKYYFVMNDINSLVNQYRGGLNVEVNDEKGSILTLSLSGPNKDQIIADLIFIRPDRERLKIEPFSSFTSTFNPPRYWLTRPLMSCIAK